MHIHSLIHTSLHHTHVAQIIHQIQIHTLIVQYTSSFNQSDECFSSTGLFTWISTMGQCKQLSGTRVVSWATWTVKGQREVTKDTEHTKMPSKTGDAILTEKVTSLADSVAFPWGPTERDNANFVQFGLMKKQPPLSTSRPWPALLAVVKSKLCECCRTTIS